MTRSIRGAARVSVVWMISTLVLFFVALGFAFVATSDLSRAEAAQAAAEQEQADAVARFDSEAEAARERARAIGWYDKESADPRINLDAVQTSLEGIKDELNNESIQTVADVFKPAMDAIQVVQDENAQLRSRITTLEGELTQARATLSTVTTQKDSELADLRQQLSDEQQKYQRNESESTRRNSELAAEKDEALAAVDAAERDKEEALREAAREKSSLAQRLDKLRTELALPTSQDSYDGKILAVSDLYPIAWIDVGANHRLARGTVFEVRSGTPGDHRLKARARVVELKPESAKVEIFDEQFEYFPVAAGDELWNDVYTRGGDRKAVLAGRFSAPSEAELTALLARIGIEVEPRLTVDTHYLIVGSAVFVDEDGEPLDEPRDPSELDVYRQAEAAGVTIVSMSRLRDFFVF